MNLKKKREPFSFVDTLLPVIVVLAFILIWQLAVSAGWIASNQLASPYTVVVTFLDKLTNTSPDGATLQINILQSLKISLAGFGLGVVTGLPVGLLMGWYQPFRSLVKPIFELVRPVPAIAWIPLTIMWIGVGDTAKILIVWLSAFIPCVLNSQTGIIQTSPVLINLAKTFGASDFETFYRFGIPSATPMMFAGIRIALGNAWATLVAAELLAANAGLGYMIVMGRQFARPDIMLLGMVTIGLLGFVFTFIFERTERYVLKWKLN